MLLVFAVVPTPGKHQAAPSKSGEALPLCLPPSIKRWEKDIVRWARENHLSPSLVVAIMAVESCGNPEAVSPAGAQGLFQVMPFHFRPGENPLDPDTNARVGLRYLRRALSETGGNLPQALAYYNAGPGALSAPWPAETQRYVQLVTAISRETAAGTCRTIQSVCR